MMDTVQLAINGFTIEKAGESSDDKTVNVRMVAHAMKQDREDDEITPQAFNKAKGDFLNRGVIDWFHKSVKGKTPEERRHAILGMPTDFQWEKEDGRTVPVVYGKLTKAHPIVREDILPHLEAGMPVFQASVGGTISKARQKFNPLNKAAVRQIEEISWGHIAIAPRNSVMSPGSVVSLIKADDQGEVNLCKNGFGEEMTTVQFNDMSAFLQDCRTAECGQASLLAKALEVGYETDSAAMTGADALRTQSLEGSSKRDVIQSIYKAVSEKRIGNDQYSVRGFMLKMGVPPHQIESVLSDVVQAGRRLAGRTGK